MKNIQLLKKKDQNNQHLTVLFCKISPHLLNSSVNKMICYIGLMDDLQHPS